MDIEEVKKILDKDREGTKATSNGVVNFVEYPTSTSKLAQQICQFEPKFNNALEADAHNWDTRELSEPKPDEGGLLSPDVIKQHQDRARRVSTMDMSTPVDIIVYTNSILKAQRDLTASIKDAEFAKEKELIFNPDWVPDVQAMLREFNESVIEIKAECQARVDKLIEEIESTSRPMNTNMYGISLSRYAWQALKQKELK